MAVAVDAEVSAATINAAGSDFVLPQAEGAGSNLVCRH